MKLNRFRRSKKNSLQFTLVCYIVGGLLIILLVFLCYKYNWKWTGFSNKTLWDWLQLLVIPLVLAVGGFLFNLTTGRNEQKIAERRYEQEKEATENQQNEELLQSYLDKMSDLIINNNLCTSQQNSQIQYIARARTMTVLSRLDGGRKSSIIQFLYEAGLIKLNGYESILNMEHADMSWAKLSFSTNLQKANLHRVYFYACDAENVDFSESDLREAVFEEADLAEAKFEKSNLSGATLFDAKLWEANLSNAKLCNALLIDADLSGANLNKANLSGANLTRARFSARRADTLPADLSGANLSGANLSGADLKGVNLSGATLSGANLDDANLQGIDLSKTNITEEQIARCKTK